jgi:putative ABC transport system substrate-binding protein
LESSPRRLYSILQQDLELQKEAERVGLSVADVALADNLNEDEYRTGFMAMSAAKVGALVVGDQPEHYTYRKVIVSLAEKHKLPAIYPYRAHVDVGGLMAYTFDIGDMGLICARIVDKVLRGARPGDIPVQQTTRFELIINLKTAKTLGLIVPPSLLARADEVIE